MATCPGQAFDVEANGKLLLLRYCKNILADIDSQKKQAEGDNQKEIILNVYQEKCSHLINEIDNQEGDSCSFVVLSDILQKIAQLLLDLTYVDECCLVDQDFLLQAAYERVSNIIEALSGIETLAKDAVPGNQLRDVLSPSIVECIHWRKGALLYMYCHTLNARCDQGQLPTHFKKCLEEGCRHLVSMLSTRSTPVWLKEPGRVAAPELRDNAGSSAEDDTDLLMSQGIYSDTHLLALMYLGEMCYWHAQLTEPPRPKSLASCLPTSEVASETASAEISTVASAIDLSKAGPKILAGVEHSAGPMSVTASSGATKAEAGPLKENMEEKSLDLLKTGQLSLGTYVRAAKGPMSVGGWNTDRAEEILQYFEKLSISS